MLPDFKGHCFEVTSEPNARLEQARCKRCGMTTRQKLDGSFEFDDGKGVLTGISPNVPLEPSHVPACSI